MTPTSMKLVLASVMVLLITASGVWKVQDWRYGQQLAEQARLHGDDLYVYLKDALTRLQTQRARTIEDLLPHRW